MAPLPGAVMASGPAIDMIAILDREIAELEIRRARARSLRRATLQDRRDEETRRMFAWYAAAPGRTKAETARHFKINTRTLGKRFAKLGLRAPTQRHAAETRRMFDWYAAEPSRTKAETAQHFGINPNTLATRFWQLGLYGVGPQSEAKARRAARISARAA
ncbi:hypothetical protein [Vineibacter terrae]|uniref:hypothetical protein n=1 Tax=Vineibacter terrae TaxID=2586908 RepID=UPI002E34852F|nr:hypothetical protein [Vineibacter terrae]HEX2886796.1 hypothetical protein [Vineibacter terrae]